MKVALVCPRTPRIYRTGIENYVRNLAPRLFKMGYGVEIFTTSPRPMEDAFLDGTGIKIREFSAISPKESYYFSPGLRKAINASDAEIVHTYGYNNLVTFSILGLRNKKIVVTLASAGNTTFFKRIFRIPYNFAFRRYSKNIAKVVCLSNYEKGFFKRILKLPGDKYEVIPNPVDKEIFAKVNPKRKKIIVSIARLVKNKRPEELIRSFKIFSEENPEYQLWIIGSGPLYDRLLFVIKSLNLEERVFLKDTKNRLEIIKWLKQSSLFVLLSDHPSPAISVSEAVEARVPVLVNSRSALVEFVNIGYASGVEGYWNYSAIAEEMKKIIKSPSKYLPKRFSVPDWDDFAYMHDKMYRRLFE